MLNHAEGSNIAISAENRDKELPVQAVMADKGKRPAGKAQYKPKTSVSTVSGSKDPPPRPISAPPTEASISMSNPKTNASQFSHNVTPSQLSAFNKEALEILREMNKNIDKTNEKVEALSIRADTLSKEDKPENYDYELYYDDYGDDNGQDETVPQPQIKVDQRENDSDNNELPESIFQRFSKTSKKSDVTSDPIDSQVASLVNEAFKEGMADEMHQDLIKKIYRP